MSNYGPLLFQAVGNLESGLHAPADEISIRPHVLALLLLAGRYPRAQGGRQLADPAKIGRHPAGRKHIARCPEEPLPYRRKPCSQHQDPFQPLPTPLTQHLGDAFLPRSHGCISTAEASISLRTTLSHH
ncbi:hypothetical protein QR680_007293 [Steinernema hermaphroditum]|uniref:Uncharacterized protein n=1 Tax=Steinernema hermaphroditum TaxID=289476 RepID=A0AA39IEX9_9BILA|nr:hypothetical protein QR680_007293 [Steinernema hermaphroditum]